MTARTAAELGGGAGGRSGNRTADGTTLGGNFVVQDLDVERLSFAPSALLHPGPDLGKTAHRTHPRWVDDGSRALGKPPKEILARAGDDTSFARPSTLRLLKQPHKLSTDSCSKRWRN